MAKKTLTPKQQMFVTEYLVDLNATQAAIRAGYSRHRADAMGHENLRKPVISAAVQQAMNERSSRVEITADRVLQELAKMGFANIRNVYSANGSLTPIHEMELDISAAITEVTEDIVGNDGEGVVIRRKYKLADKRGALELIGKHLKLFTDRVEVDNIRSITTEDLQAEARALAEQILREKK